MLRRVEGLSTNFSSRIFFLTSTFLLVLTIFAFLPERSFKFFSPALFWKASSGTETKSLDTIIVSVTRTVNGGKYGFLDVKHTETFLNYNIAVALTKIVTPARKLNKSFIYKNVRT